MLCDHLEGWDGVGGGRRFKREGAYVYLWLIHASTGQKPTQYCKAIILQLQISKKKRKKEILSTDFPGGPVAKTLSSQHRGLEFHPWWGN